jgi:hypothetical protein
MNFDIVLSNLVNIRVFKNTIKKMKFGIIIFSIITLILSYILSRPYEMYIEVGPIQTYTSRDIVYKCFKQQFTSEHLWKKFDLSGAVKEVKLTKSTDDNIDFFIIKEHTLLGFRFNTTLVAGSDFKNYSVASVARSTDGLIEARPTVELYEENGKTIIVEKTTFSVPLFFAYYTYNIALKEHTENLYLIRDLIEKDNNLCNL